MKSILLYRFILVYRKILLSLHGLILISASLIIYLPTQTTLFSGMKTWSSTFYLSSSVSCSSVFSLS